MAAAHHILKRSLARAGARGPAGIVTGLGRLALIYVTNSAGDSIHVIDPATNKVVQEIKGVGSRPWDCARARRLAGLCQQRGRHHARRLRSRERGAGQEGAAEQSPQQHRGDQERRPHPGRHRARPGAVDVIDAKTLTRTKSILVKGRLHNIYVTPDGKHLITGSIPAKLMTVIDLEREVPVWELHVRPGRASDGDRGRPRRVDQADLRAALGHQRLRGGGFRGPQGGRAGSSCRRRRPNSRPTPGAPRRRRTASASRPTTRRCGSPASPTMRCSSIRSRISSSSARWRCRPQAARTRPDRLGAELGDVHARQQDDLYLECRHQVGDGHRYRQT